jgi:hypothetical protein
VSVKTNQTFKFFLFWLFSKKLNRKNKIEVHFHGRIYADTLIEGNGMASTHDPLMIEDVRAASVLAIALVYVREMRPKLLLELDPLGEGMTDEEIDEVLVDRWDSLGTEERVKWWTKSKKLQEDLLKLATRPTELVTMPNQTDVVDGGKYAGCRLPGKRSGYQNFCSKQFRQARLDLARHHSISVETVQIADIWRKLGLQWGELVQAQRDTWKAFAKGKATQPALERFVQHPTRAISREASVDDVKTEVATGVATPFIVQDYLDKFQIMKILETAINGAIGAQSPDPRIFIANYLYEQAGVSGARLRACVEYAVAAAPQPMVMERDSDREDVLRDEGNAAF